MNPLISFILLFLSSVCTDCSVIETKNKKNRATVPKVLIEEEINKISRITNMDHQVNENHKINSILFAISVLLMLLMSFISHLLKVNEIHFIPESGVCLLIGMIVGFILKTSPERDITIGNCTVSGHSITNNLTMAPEIILAMVGKKNGYFQSYEISSSSIRPETLSLLSYKAQFNPEIFFYFILPPIMFCAGFKMNKKLYYRNFSFTILISIIGTLITSLLFSAFVWMLSRTVVLPVKEGRLSYLEALLFASLIAPTDPVSIISIFNLLKVDQTLYALVFGESSLNDVISLVLHRAVEHQLSMFEGSEKYSFGVIHTLAIIRELLVSFFSSASIGIGVAIMTSMVTKLTSFEGNHILETTIFLLLSYTSFLLAETAGMIGVISVFFCGIFQAHYTLRNLSHTSKNNAHAVFDLWSYMAENFSFAYMGITIMVTKHIWNGHLISIGIVGIMSSRAVMVYMLSLLANQFRKEKIPFSYQHIMVIAGMKGAFSFALASQNISTLSRELILTTTTGIILFTVFICGAAVYPAIKFLKIPISSNTGVHETSQQDENDRYSDNFVEKTWILRLWEVMDERYLLPFITVDGPPFSSFLPGCCRSLFVRIESIFGKRSNTNGITEESSCIVFDSMDEDL